MQSPTSYLLPTRIAITQMQSVTGHAPFCRGNLIHWRSIKQRRVSHSVCEAELLALEHMVKEAIYYRELAAELKLPDHLSAQSL